MMSNAIIRSRSGYRRGFTLIELLVVISIIALLISILLPSLAGARESARAVQCLTQQQQIGVTVQLYLNDFDETFYERRNWHRWIPEELIIDDENATDKLTSPGLRTFIDPNAVNDEDLGQLAYWGVIYADHAETNRAMFRCPAARRSDSNEDYSESDAENDGPYSEGHEFNTYAQNNWSRGKAGTGIITPLPEGGSMVDLSGRNDYRNEDWVGNKLYRINFPSDLIFMLDSYEATIEGNGDIPALQANEGSTFDQWLSDGRYLEYFRHLGKSQILWVDGHVSGVGEFEEWEVRWFGEPRPAGDTFDDRDR